MSAEKHFEGVIQSLVGRKPDGSVSRARDSEYRNLISEEDSMDIFLEICAPYFSRIKSEHHDSLIDGSVFSDDFVTPQNFFLHEIKRHPHPYDKYLGQSDTPVAFLHTAKLFNLIDVCFQFGVDVWVTHVWAEEADWSKVTIAVHSVRALYTALWDSVPRSLSDLWSPDGALWRPHHPKYFQDGDVVHFDPKAAYWVSVWEELDSGFHPMEGSPDVSTLLKVPTWTNWRNLVLAQQALGIPKHQLWPHLCDWSGEYGEPRFADLGMNPRFRQGNSDRRTHPLKNRAEGKSEPRGMGNLWRSCEIKKSRAYMRSLSTFPPNLRGSDDVLRESYEIEVAAA